MVTKEHLKKYPVKEMWIVRFQRQLEEAAAGSTDITGWRQVVRSPCSTEIDKAQVK